MIYLDNSATTKISDAALEKYLEVSREAFGNPSSLHTLGVDAEGVLTAARREVARALGASSGRVIFTAGGSEANNLAILGRVYAKERFRGKKILTTEGEHASVTNVLTKLEKEGYRVVRIHTKNGVIDESVFRRELSRDVCLVTMMSVNNETGAHYSLGALAKELKATSPDAVLHVDMTQGFLKTADTPTSLHADMITVSSHKIHGPKGVGALWISDEIVKTRGLSPILFGGGQEGGYRSGTENVPAIAAFGEACRLGRAALAASVKHLGALRDDLIRRIQGEPALSEVKLLLPERAAPHILSMTLPAIKSETMLHFLSREGICVSSGSACSSNGAHHPSAAFLAFGLTEAEADATIRVSFSCENTVEENALLIDALKRGVFRLARMR